MITDDFERKVYLQLFGKAVQRTDWRCVAYCLMSSHLHFGLIPGTHELQSWAKRVNSPFARWLNSRHDGLGPVFADRPAEWVVRDHPAALIAYIHNNPVRAGVVPRAIDSTWSSHRAYLDRASAPAWLHVDVGLALCGFRSKQGAEFDSFVDATVHSTHELPDLAALRAAVRSKCSAEIATPVLTESTCEVPVVISPTTIIRPPIESLLECASRLTHVAAPLLCSRSNIPATVAAKRVLVHAGRCLGYSGSQLARLLGITPQAVSKHFDAATTSAQREAIDSIVNELTCEVASTPRPFTFELKELKPSN